MLRLQASPLRLVGLSAGGLLAVAVAVMLRSARQSDPLQVGAILIGEYGLWLLVPITALLLSSSTLGELYDDGTLVYLWLRPIPRSRLVFAAVLSTFSLALPITLVPLLLAAVVSRGGQTLTVGVLVTVPLVLFAYVGVFSALALKSRRSVIWGLFYIFIIEGFVARGGESLAKLAIRSYGYSVLGDMTEATLEPFAVVAAPWSWLMPLVIGALSVGYAVHRLHVQDVP